MPRTRIHRHAHHDGPHHGHPQGRCRAHDSARIKGQKTLCDLQVGQEAIITDIAAGRQLNARLNAMGIRCGKRVTKKTDFWHGPVAVDVEGTTFALRWGEAVRILVRLES